MAREKISKVEKSYTQQCFFSSFAYFINIYNLMGYDKLLSLSSYIFKIYPNHCSLLLIF